MDLPRAEIRYHGLAAVGAAIVRRWHRMGGWLRPRIAPLAITALATVCMLAGLDLIAHDFRKLRDRPEPPRPMVIYLMPMPAQHAQQAEQPPSNLIPIELVPVVQAAPAEGCSPRDPALDAH